MMDRICGRTGLPQDRSLERCQIYRSYGGKLRSGLAPEADRVKVAGDIGATVFHPVGAAKMGRNDVVNAVVVGRSRANCVTGLRIVDASIMPTITSGNPNSPILMLAEKAAAGLPKFYLIRLLQYFATTGYS